MVIHAISLVDVIEAYLSENKVFQLPKTLFIQVLFFLFIQVFVFIVQAHYWLYNKYNKNKSWMNKKNKPWMNKFSTCQKALYALG